MIYSVEDDAAIRELIVYALRQAGYEAEGFEAVSYTHLDVYKRQHFTYALQSRGCFLTHPRYTFTRTEKKRRKQKHA